MFNFRRAKSRAYIGADIDASHIKLIEISQKNGQFTVENYVIYSRSSEWQTPLTSNLFFHSREIVTAVLDSQILSKKIRVGKKLSEREMEECASLEMEKMALCSASDLCVDFQILEKNIDQNDSDSQYKNRHQQDWSFQDKRSNQNEPENILEILSVAVRRQTIESLQQCFHGTEFGIKKIGLMSQIVECLKKNQAMQDTPETQETPLNQEQILNTCVDLKINARISGEQWQKDAPSLLQASQVAMFFLKQQDESALNAVWHMTQNYAVNAGLNFLPWRKERRVKKQKIRLAACMGGVFLLILVYFVLDNAFKHVSNVATIVPVPSSLTVIKPIKPVQKTLNQIKKRPSIGNNKLKSTSEKFDYSLENTPIQAFKFVGFMKENRKIWGIIQTPDGKIFHVSVGDVVGKEQGIVIDITSKKILLDHHNINKSNRRYVIE